MSKCRIMYSIPVSPGEQPKQHSLYKLIAKAVGAVILSAIFLVYLWALFWVACALDDVCYAANMGGL